MRAALLVAVAGALLSAGCIQAAEDAIERARGNATPAEAPQESTAPNATSPGEVFGPPTPTPAPGPAPSPTPPPPAPRPSTPPAPSPSPPSWPREGSFVSYTLHEGQSFAGSTQEWESFANVTWTYHDGDWRGVCDGERHDRSDGVTWSNTTLHASFTAAHPPHWPPFDTRAPPAPGEPVTVWYVRGCGLVNETRTFAGPAQATVPAPGGARAVDAYRATGDPTDEPFSFQTEWSSTTGLVLSWSWARGGSAEHA